MKTGALEIFLGKNFGHFDAAPYRRLDEGIAGLIGTSIDFEHGSLHQTAQQAVRSLPGAGPKLAPGLLGEIENASMVMCKTSVTVRAAAGWLFGSFCDGC
jgi:hypothetical protein